MLIDFDTKITNLEGLPLKMDGVGEVTLKFCAITALFGQYNDGFDQDVKEKRNRYKLAHKIQKSPICDVSQQDVDKVKTLIGKAFSTLIMGSALDILEHAVESAKNKVHEDKTSEGER